MPRSSNNIFVSTPLLATSYLVKVDYDKTVEELAEEGKYDSKNDDVNSIHFPSTESGQAELSVYLFEFKHFIRSEAILRKMDKLGFRPTTTKELLSLGAQYPSLQSSRFIMSLGGTLWRGYDDRICLPDLSNYWYDTRLLGISFFDSYWYPGWRFAAVRK